MQHKITALLLSLFMLLVPVAAQQNPFDGSQTLPIRQQAKTAVVNGTIYKLVIYGPGASGWEDTGVAAVDPNLAPPRTGVIPAALVNYVRNASPVDYDAVKARSAMSVAITNENYNQQIFEVYCEKFIVHATVGRGPAPVSPVPFYRIADFATIFQLMQAGIEIPVPAAYPSR